MRKDILQKVQAELEQQRMRNAQEERRRRAEVERRSPELAALLNSRQELIYGSMRGILAGKGSYDDLPQRMEVLNQRITAQLTALGYPADYLEPVYSCKLCRDTGYTGEPVREMCTCMRRAYFAQIYQEVGLNPQEEESFERFDLSVFPETLLPRLQVTQRRMMDFARQECQDWSEHYPNVERRDMLLSGKSGLGKTYLLHCMARVLLNRGYQVLLLSAYRMLDIARRAYIERQTTELDNLIQVDVLMLDDLGTEPLMENITIVQLFHIINERQSAGRATIISTNLNEKELRDRYTERVASRLLDTQHCALLTLEGDDVRRLRRDP